MSLTWSRSIPVWALVGMLLAGCSAGGPETAASSPASVDALALASEGCLTVDGAAHVELQGNLGAQFDAQADDRGTGAETLARAAKQDAKYSEAATKLKALAEQSARNAANYRSNPEALAREALQGGVQNSPIVRSIVEARSACTALGLPTKP